MIKQRTPQDIIAYCRMVLGIDQLGKQIDDIFLMAMLRRTAGALCPCSRTVLRTALVESLSFLHDESDSLGERLENLTNDLIVAGDLLELSDVTTGEIDAKGTWVFASPPSFIVRKSNRIYIIGIVPDQDSFLPEALSRRVVHSNNVRYITPESGEDLANSLAAEGLNQIQESVWIKTPKMLSADELLLKAQQRLSEVTQCAPITDMEIINPDRIISNYRGRWSKPTDQTGTFVARRLQEFGAPIWCFVELYAGTLIRIIDLPLGTYLWRGCDAAWHLQMAIDRLQGQPQRYRLSEANGISRFDFFSPLPLWAERHLMVLGRKLAGEKSLFAYEIPASETSQEAEFLKNYLWLEQLEI
jgi:hypothetical protein